jgi:iron complex outermembrane recepter protein
VAAALLILGVAPLRAASPDDSNTSLTIDIEPQPLEAALVELSRQGHLQLVMSTESLRSMQSTGLHGHMPLVVALESLLKDTGLTFKFIGEHTVAIIKSNSPATQSIDFPVSPALSGDSNSEPPSSAANADTGGKDNNTDGGSQTVKHQTVLLRVAMFLGICASVANSGTACAQAAAGAETGGLEEVTVTAERRSEFAQSAPLALAVVSGEEIANQGVSQPEDLNKLIPGLQITNAPITTVSIRGVGTFSELDSLAQLGVAVSTDGVYIDRVTEVAGNFYDLNRVEVVLGPQGTLYGRNATGGAVNLISNKPTNEFGGNIQEELGDFGLRRTTGALNVPVTDELAFRFAFYDSKRDGYLSDGYDDEDTRAGRLHALWTPDSNLSLLVTLEASRVGGVGQGGAFEGLGLTGAQSSPLANTLHQLADIPSANGPVPIPLPYPSYQDFYNTGARAQLDWNLGFATLTVIPGYKAQTFNYDQVAQVNGSEASQGSTDQFTVEARLSKSSEKWKWTLGLFSLNEHVDFDFHAGFVGLSIPPIGVYGTIDQFLQAPNYDTRSDAAFGETTYSFTDRFRGIIGARYTSETKSADIANQWYGEFFAIPGHSTQAIDPLTGLLNNLYAYNTNTTLHTADTTGKVGLEYDLAPHSLLYATVSQGFKGGGFGLAPPPQTTYLPEYLTAYTLGIKNRFDSNRVQLNGELYYWDYTNQQLSVVVPDIYGALEQITVNAGKSRIDGAEISVLWAPEPQDRLGMQLQYEQATFVQYNVITGMGPSGSAPSGCIFTPTTYFGFQVYNQNCAGLHLPNTPEWSGIAEYAHTFGLGSGAHVVFNGDVHFSSWQQTQVTVDPQYLEHGYGIVDLDLKYQSPKDVWSLTGYVRNVGDKFVYTHTTVNNFSPAIPPNIAAVSSILPPRTFGVILKVSF